MHVLAVCTGKPETLQGKRYKTGINKQPIATVNVTLNGVENDAVCDRRYQGGPDQAVYVEGGRSLEQWDEEFGLPVEFGQFGENLVIGRLDNVEVAIGDRLEIGEVVLEVTAPRMPCATFAANMGDPQFVKKYLKAGRPGFYCRVIRPGTLTKAMGAAWLPFAGARILMPQVMRDYGKIISGETLATYLAAPIHTKLRASLSHSGKVKF